MPFCRFMELALYCPDYGYYEGEKDNIGRKGDFFTSVKTGKFFGELLAARFSTWIEPLLKDKSASFKASLVECGAHDGTLASNILTWFQARRPDLLRHLTYYIVEPSPRRSQWQRKRLETFKTSVKWVGDLDSLEKAAGSSKIHGLIFCNELLDAMPLRRIAWDKKKGAWLELGVVVDRAGNFVWSPDFPQAAGEELQAEIRKFFGDLEAQLRPALPDKFTTEICPQASQWWQEAARTLAPGGKLLTLDYGLMAEEFLKPERSQGTLRAYRGHRVSHDILACPGEQDITAHVNFSALIKAGESAGMVTRSLETQERFLTRAVADLIAEKRVTAEWLREGNRQLQTLVNPEHLGANFKVFLQEKA